MWISARLPFHNWLWKKELALEAHRKLTAAVKCGHFNDERRPHNKRQKVKLALDEHNFNNIGICKSKNQGGLNVFVLMDVTGQNRMYLTHSTSSHLAIDIKMKEVRVYPPHTMIHPRLGHFHVH